MIINLAIDPGKNGAMAILIGEQAYAYDCPDSQKEIVSMAQEAKRLAILNECKISAAIEKVNCMPGQGVKSVWSFSANYATWQTALIACEIPFYEISPQAWQKKLGGLPKEKKERKDRIKDMMSKRYPSLKVTLKNADALAILTTEFLTS